MPQYGIITAVPAYHIVDGSLAQCGFFKADFRRYCAKFTADGNARYQLGEDIICKAKQNPMSIRLC